MCGVSHTGERRSPSAPTAEQQEIDKAFAHPLVQEALEFLTTSLPSDLYYHNIEHTRKVIEATVRCAVRDGLSARDVELLAIAAAWHDTGYAITKKLNEPHGAKFAGDAMARAGGYTPEEIATVCSAILDTQVQFDREHDCMIQKALGRLSPWLLDGDLSNFGTNDFFVQSLALLRELTGIDAKGVEDLNCPKAVAFIAASIRMLNRHSFQTDAAKALFDDQKRSNFIELGTLLASLVSGTPESRESAWRAMFPQER